MAQSDEAAPDIKTAFSKLSVTPKSLSYDININMGVFSETKHFHITNEGTVPLKVVVNTPSNPAYVVRSGGGTTTIPGKVKGSKAGHLSTVDVEFIPNGSVKSDNGTIGVISDATSGKKFALVALNGKSKKWLNPTATATATATRSNGDSNRDADGNCDLNADGDGDHNSDGYGDLNSDCNRDRDGDSNHDRNRDRDCHSHRNCDCNHNSNVLQRRPRRLQRHG